VLVRHVVADHSERSLTSALPPFDDAASANITGSGSNA